MRTKEAPAAKRKKLSKAQLDALFPLHPGRSKIGVARIRRAVEAVLRERERNGAATKTSR